MAESTYEHLLVERRGDGVAMIVINRPQKLNAFSSQTRGELVAALRMLNSNSAVGAIVLTGAGDRAFTTGDDLSEAQQFGSEHAASWVDQWKEVYETILGLEKPIIAAVNGYAVGAGFQMATDCDLRIAANNAKFGMSEIDDGIPSVGGAFALWDLVGRGRTVEIVLTGRMIDALEALEWGIVSSVVPKEEILEVALEQARALATKSRTAIRMNKRWIRELVLKDSERSREFSRRAHTQSYASGEPQSAMANFLAKQRDGRSR